MKTIDLANAMEALAEEPTLCVALSPTDVAELREAATRLRVLETVREAAAMYVAEPDDDDETRLVPRLDGRECRLCALRYALEGVE